MQKTKTKTKTKNENQKNESRGRACTLHKNELKLDYRPKCKTQKLLEDNIKLLEHKRKHR